MRAVATTCTTDESPNTHTGLSIPPALDLDAASAVMKAALDHGANFWNGGVFYGTPDHNSLHLLRHYFTKYPEDAERVVLSIKGAYIYTRHEPDCSPEAVRRHVDEALAVLGGTKSIDIFQCARVDPKVPIEDTVAALAELVEEGKIGGIGLSEVSAATIRRAVKVHPIGAVEIELSLFTTNVLHDGVVDTCKEREFSPNLPFPPSFPVLRRGRETDTGRTAPIQSASPSSPTARSPRAGSRAGSARSRTSPRATTGATTRASSRPYSRRT